MLFPVILHTDDGISHGVTVPDVPGCFTAGDTLQEALNNIQEAIRCHLEGDEQSPEPGTLEEAQSLPEAEGGLVTMVDIDLSFITPKYRRVNITVPEPDLEAIDRAARARGQSRSRFLVDAAKVFGEGKKEAVR